MKKKYGWIFAVKGRPGVYSSGYGQSSGNTMGSIPITSKLSRAIVVSTRAKARIVKAFIEKILRVELFKNGKPKKIIERDDMKKKYGWVLEMKKNSSDYPGFYQGCEYLCGARHFRTAFVCPSRRLARALKCSDEMIRKVELFKNGKPKKIVGRG